MNTCCEDCGAETDGLKSRKFDAYLCRTCWEARTGWNVVLEAAADPDKSNKEVEELAKKAREASL
jgi:hypothetical protein